MTDQDSLGHVRSDSGNRTYIITTSRMTSGNELKRRKEEEGRALDLRFMRSC